MSEITQILSAVRKGDQQSTEELLAVVYTELRRLAASRLAQEPAGQTIQATELVHEAYLRLIGGADPKGWDGRRHFFAAAAEAMRRILIERARHKASQKCGGALRRVDLDGLDVQTPQPDEELLAVNSALEELSRADSQAAELVKLRFFVGLTQAQSAEILGVSTRTADNIWAFARAWLYRAVHRDL